MSLLIPLRSDLPFFDLQVELDGTRYALQLRWNVRDEAWYLDVLDETGETRLWGSRVVVDFPLVLHTFRREPPGALMFFDTSGAHADPGISDLGARVLLRYVPAAELGL